MCIPCSKVQEMWISSCLESEVVRQLGSLFTSTKKTEEKKLDVKMKFESKNKPGPD